MTPLHLDILGHYYTCADDYELLETNRTRWEYAFDLARKGYLYTPDFDLPDQVKRFEITEYGKRVFERILNYFSSI